MKLLPHELQSAVWIKLAAHLREQVEIDRSKLEDDTITKKRTTQLRARIRFSKELLALGEPSPAEVAADEQSAA